MARDNVTFDDLVKIAQSVGVEVVSAPSSHRGKLGKMGTVVGATLHHTGTPNSTNPTNDYPDYNVVKEGRSGLVNSLSAFGLGRRKAIYVFSEYLSWHAGDWLYAGIKDGNGHFLGIEAAGVGDWTPWQLDIYPRLVAAILRFLGEGIDMMPRHMDGAMPRGRKTDAANLPPNFKARVQYYLDHPAEINVNATQPLEEVMADVASLKFVTSPTDTNTWWATDGLVRRLVLPGEPDLLMQLGLAEKHDEKTNQTVAVIAQWQLDRLAIVDGSGLQSGQTYHAYNGPSAADIAAAIVNAQKAV